MNSVGRRLLAVILSGALAGLPLFAASPRSSSDSPSRVASLGFVDSATGAEISGVQAVAGSTVFNGDDVKVLPSGRLAVTLAGGSQAFFGPGADASLVRNGAAVAVKLKSGGVLISAGKSPVEGLAANVTFRPAAAGPSSGWLGLDDNGHMVLYANRGDWLVSTTDGRTKVTLRQGNRMEGSLSSPDRLPGQRSQKKKKRLAAFWISAGAAGLGAGLALAYEGSNPIFCVDPPGVTVCKPVVSPVAP